MRRGISLFPPLGLALLASAGMALVVPASAGAVDPLSLIPADSAAVAMIHLAPLRTNPLSTKLFEETCKASGDADAAKFLEEAGFDPKQDIDTIVFSTSFAPGAGTEPRVLVAAEGRFQMKPLVDAIAARGGLARTAGNRTYYRLQNKGGGVAGRSDRDEAGAVAFVDSHLAVVGTEQAVVAALTSLATGGTRFSSGNGLGHELSRVWSDATAWALIDATQKGRFGAAGAKVGKAASESAVSGLVSAMQSVSRILMQTTVTSSSLKFCATGLIPDEETRKLIEDTLRGLTALWRMAVQDKSPELVPVIRAFEISRDAEGVTIEGTLPQEFLDIVKAKTAKTAQ